MKISKASILTSEFGFIGAFDPYHGGEKGFILYTNEIEPDDTFHMPQDDDDITYKPKLSEYFNRRQIVSTIGAIFLICGLLCIFIVLPVLTFTTHLIVPAGKGYVNDSGKAFNNNTYSLLQNFRRGLIDPDTPAIAKTRKSTFDGSTLNLVFSDEFNDDNRTFYPGDDPFCKFLLLAGHSYFLGDPRIGRCKVTTNACLPREHAPLLPRISQCCILTRSF